jgi:tetratricopeptide (TPR) repeat protein
VLGADLRRNQQAVNGKMCGEFGAASQPLDEMAGQHRWRNWKEDSLCGCGIAHATETLPASSSNHYRNATRDYTKALKLYPTDAWALWNRGLAWKGLGEMEKAEEDQVLAKEVDPSFPPTQ